MPLGTQDHKIVLVLITTKSELESGAVETCLDRYTKSVSLTKSVDIIVTLNTKTDTTRLNRFRGLSAVNSLEIHNCMIPVDQDIYTHDDKPLIIHELGQSNGPNQSFFKSMNHLRSNSADFFMVIESDTQPVCDCWLDRLIEYCNMKQFIIGGTRYKGDQKLPDCDWRDHLNGVALYKNCDELFDILKGSRDLLHTYIHKKSYKRLNYDIAIWYFVNSPSGDKYLSAVIDTNIIANYSLPSDTTIRTQTILDKHPYTVILHQKQ